MSTLLTCHPHWLQIILRLNLNISDQFTVIKCTNISNLVLKDKLKLLFRNCLNVILPLFSYPLLPAKCLILLVIIMKCSAPVSISWLQTNKKNGQLTVWLTSRSITHISSSTLTQTQKTARKPSFLWPFPPPFTNWGSTRSMPQYTCAWENRWPFSDIKGKCFIVHALFDCSCPSVLTIMPALRGYYSDGRSLSISVTLT